MYFLPRNNTFNSLLININPIVRYILIIILISFFGFFWFFSFYEKFNDKIVRLKADINNLEHKKNLLNKIKEEINQTYLFIQNINFQFEEIYKSYQNNLDGAVGIDLLMENAKKSGLIIITCNSDGHVKKQFYEKNIISCSLKGSFEQTIEFLSLLKNSKQWIKCKKINISHVKDDQIQLDCIYKFYIPKKGIGCLTDGIFV